MRITSSALYVCQCTVAAVRWLVVQMEVLEGTAGDADHLDHQSEERDEQDRHSEHSDHDQNAADLEGSKFTATATLSLYGV